MHRLDASRLGVGSNAVVYAFDTDYQLSLLSANLNWKCQCGKEIGETKCDPMQRSAI